MDLKPHDYMAVVPVVEAAGGTMTDWEGGPLGLRSSGNVVAAGSAELHREFIALLRLDP
jgi:fructose-1,6-bisphosphatase/inositol monophosphatase family enzyme